MRVIHKIFLVLVFMLFSQTALAQESVTLSVSPTLYDMSAEPNQEWSSTLKIINVNKFDLTVYLEVVNFVPRGESGDVRFLPVNESEADGGTLAEWFSITKAPVVVPREQTLEIPFSVRVPDEANPGGHYAAILVGTKPLTSEPGEANLQTAQVVTSLFFARVAGDVVESGSIREFTTNDSYLNSPEVTFSLRFENKGNVDLQPQGEIKVYNMWGQERGTIPINQYTNFGKVTRDSIRKFTFTWKGEWSVSDIGRYTAVATLGYGISEKKFSSSKTIFWVIPYKLLLGIFVGLSIFVFLVTWLVRLYIRHMLTMAGINVDNYQAVRNRAVNTKSSHPKVSLHAPVQAGILDLTKKLQASFSLRARFITVVKFIYQYRLFFFALILITTFVALITWYISSANTKHRAFEVEYVNHDSSTSVNSEEIIYNQLKVSVSEELVVNPDLPKVVVVNRSGIPGVGAKTKLKLQRLGYEVKSLSADFSIPQKRTVIIFPDELQGPALDLSSILKNALASAATPSETADEITIFLGSDQDLE